MEYPDKLVVMTSGGVDSTAVAYHLRKVVPHLRAIAVNYGQLEFPKARQCLNRMSVALDLPLEIVDIRNLVGNFSGFIEKDYDGYSMMLTELSRKSTTITMLCGIYAESIGYHGLAEGVNKDDLKRYTYRTEVHKHVAATQSLGNSFEFKVITPLIEMTRAEVLHFAIDSGVPLESTWSCWAGTLFHCGVCPGCQSRKTRFMEAGLDDPVKYLDQSPPTHINEQVNTEIAQSEMSNVPVFEPIPSE